MSKTKFIFDMICAHHHIYIQKAWLNDLKGIINHDELLLIKLLLDEYNFNVKLEGQKRIKFITNIEIPQGDGATALLYNQGNQLENEENILLISWAFANEEN